MPFVRFSAMACVAAAIACAQTFDDLKIERMSVNHRFTEGPVWTPEGRLLFTDVPTSQIFVWNPGHKPEVLRKESGGASGLAYDNKGALYVCETQSRRVTRVDKKGKVEVVADAWEGKKLNAPNDVVVRRDGNVYFTDPAFGDQMDRRELDFFGVYHVNPKGELKLIAKPAGRPNGVAISPNGKILYVTNSDERKVYAYDLDKNGDATNERVLVAGIDGPPDGITVDEKGNLFVAARGLQIYTAEGKLIRSVEFVEPVSNCKFGETDLQSLFVTARANVYRVRMPFKGALQYGTGSNQ